MPLPCCACRYIDVRQLRLPPFLLCLDLGAQHLLPELYQLQEMGGEESAGVGEQSSAGLDSEIIRLLYTMKYV